MVAIDTDESEGAAGAADDLAHKNILRRLAEESEHEKMVRYLAATFAARKGLSMDDARQIAENNVTQHERDMRNTRRKRFASQSKGKIKKKKKGPQYIYGLRGPPLQGGAPGLGKRR